MADIAFDVQYDGPVLRSHEMDVRSLAPSLLAFADLFQEMNQAQHPFSPAVTVNVRATSEGLFLVELSLAYRDARSILTSDDAIAAANLTALLSFTGLLVSYVVKKWRSPITHTSVVDDAESSRPAVRIEFEDGSSIEIPTQVVELERNISVKRSLNELVRPLHADGIESLRIRREGNCYC
jgi:hypothetical protein